MRDIGGEDALKATLQDFYKQEIDALSSRRQRRAARRLCELYLISPDGRRLSIEEHEIHRNLKLSGEILGKLVDRRLLRSDQRADRTYYEISHDTLVEPVLATSRVKGRFLGSLIAFAGALLLLVSFLVAGRVSSNALGSLLHGFKSPLPGVKDVPAGDVAFFAFLVLFVLWFLLPIAFAGVSLLRRGVRRFRRYRPRA
jgi:hypothetical protein